MCHCLDIILLLLINNPKLILKTFILSKYANIDSQDYLNAIAKTIFITNINSIHYTT